MHWLVTQTWERLLFAHWRADPVRLRPFLPSGVEPDVRDGSAWVALVAFQMVGTRLHTGPRWRGLPPIPELNLRTYVRVRDEPGVWFLSLDTTSPLFVTIGRTLFGLRYRRARMTSAVEGETVHCLSVAGSAGFSASYAPAGSPTPAAPGSLEDFLFERYRLFAERRGQLVTAEVAHEPWPLQAAHVEIRLNAMAPAGLDLRSTPIVHYCRSVDALVSFPVPCERQALPRMPTEPRSPVRGSRPQAVAEH